MITTNDEVRATIVLTHQGIENGVTRTGIAHSSRQHSQDSTICRIVVGKQHLVAAHTHISGNIVTLSIANQWMQVQAIDSLQRALLDILMSAMDRVTRLETNDTCPTTLGEQLARLRWCIAILRKSLMLQGYYAYRATQQYITLLVHRLHTRM